MMKRLCVATMLVIAVVFAFTGCGGNVAPAGNDSTGAANQPAQQATSVTFWDGIWNEERFPELQALWNERFPDVELIGEFQIDQGMSDRYMLALMTGTAPDVMLTALDWSATFGGAGLLSPLNDLIDADNFDLSPFIQGAINAATIDGNLYGLPWRSETLTLFYNRDLLAGAGFNSPPTTWDEVLNVAEAVHGDGVSGFGLVGSNFGNLSFQYIKMLRSSGGDILTPDYSAATINTPAGLAAAQLYRNLANFAPASLLENDNTANRNLFASGLVAMYVGGIFDVPEIIGANPDLNFGAALYPTNNAARGTVLGGWSVVIPRDASNRNASWEFVKFITDPAVASIYTNTFTGTGVPAAHLLEYPAEILAVAADALNYATALPPVPSILPIRRAMYDNLVLTLSDTLTIEEAVSRLDNDINELLLEDN